MRKFTAISLAALAAFVAASAIAQPAAPAAGQQAPHAQARAEMTRAQVAERSNAMFARMDANKDGKLDAADRGARAQTMFDRMDTDRNGAISREEFNANHESRGERPRMGRQGEGPQAGRGKPMQGMGGMRGGMMGGTADGNGDGAISQTEFNAAALARFDAADANKDGKLGAEERRAARPQMRAAPRAGQAN